MNFKDEARLHGIFDIRVIKAGREIEHYRDENMIMSSARDALARLIGGAGSGKTVTKIGVGTNGNGPTPDDNLSGHGGSLFRLHHRRRRSQRQEHPGVRPALFGRDAVRPQDARRHREGGRH